MGPRNCGYCSHCAVGDYDYITRDKSIIEAQRRRIQELKAELLAIHEIACLGWSNCTPIKPEDPSTLRGVKILVETINSMEAQLASKQTQIDQLMLEYCPEDMTPEQVEEWEKHQVPASDDMKILADLCFGSEPKKL